VKDLQKFKDFASEMGIYYSAETYPEGIKYADPEIPRSIVDQIKYRIYFLGANTYFDKNGDYLGSVVGDEQPDWEGRL
jgi:hypothetical protein